MTHSGRIRALLRRTSPNVLRQTYAPPFLRATTRGGLASALPHVCGGTPESSVSPSARHRRNAQKFGGVAAVCDPQREQSHRFNGKKTVENRQAGLTGRPCRVRTSVFRLHSEPGATSGLPRPGVEWTRWRRPHIPCDKIRSTDAGARHIRDSPASTAIRRRLGWGVAPARETAARAVGCEHAMRRIAIANGVFPRASLTVRGARRAALRAGPPP
jgi:hypothetical protein